MSPARVVDLEILVRRELPSLLRFGYVLTGSRHDGEDLTYEAIEVTFGRLRALRNPDAFTAYARTVMLRRHLRQVRRRRETPTAELPAGPPMADPTTASDDRILIEEAFKHVSPKNRAVLVLRYYLDWSEKDIARALRCPTGTVKARASRGLDQLRSYLDSTASRTPSGEDHS